MRIGNRLVGRGQPCFLVAEAGANHEGKFEKALELIDAARSARADAIKFQHYTAGGLVSKEAKRYWLVRGDNYGFQFDPALYKEDQYSTFAKIDGIPREHDGKLMAYAASRGIVMFSTPFDFESVDHLASLDVPTFKIASGDLTYHQLLDYAARKGKPMILSTGAANLGEIREAVEVILKTGNDQLILLHCTLAYPTPLANANLLMMRHLQKEFPDALIGLSDHTPGAEADVAAAMLGAVMIEKHFTHTPGPATGTNKVGESPDHDIGIDGQKFLEMSVRIRANEDKGQSALLGRDFDDVVAAIRRGSHPLVLGDGYKCVDSDVELKARVQARRSVVATVPLKKGTAISQEMLKNGVLACKRPGTGIPPFAMVELVGRTLRQDVVADSVLRWSHFD